jgi:OOP family OmpA-OmpF porin
MVPRVDARFLPGVLALIACAAVWVPATRAAEPQPWEVSVGAGWLDPPSKRNLDAGPAALLTFGHRFSETWGAEIFGIGANTDFTSGASGGDMRVLGVRALYHFQEIARGWTPFVSLGAAHTDIESGDSEGSALGGVGLRYRLSENWSLRGEVNLHYGFDVKATDLSAFAGIAYQWGRAPARAPAAAPVATPAAVAAAPAAPVDTDGDGVPDHLDKCPGTPKGVKVDQHGCMLDSDGDGVPDFFDKCPGTPRGAKVDAVGCPLKLTERVSIRLNVNFDTNKADIKPAFAQEIQKVAAFMRRYPTTRVVIEGHTDNIGKPDYNQKLSERRAEAVAQSLVRDHGVAADRVRSVGYGQERPIADNRTSEGRATNRRVTAELSETVTRTQ